MNPYCTLISSSHSSHQKRKNHIFFLYTLCKLNDYQSRQNQNIDYRCVCCEINHPRTLWLKTESFISSQLRWLAVWTGPSWLILPCSTWSWFLRGSTCIRSGRQLCFSLLAGAVVLTRLLTLLSKRCKCKWKLLSWVQLYVTSWAAARQAPLSMEFSRQAYWSG